MRAYQGEFHLTAMARVLGIFPSGYYAWLKRERSARAQSDEVLAERVRGIHERSRHTYGAPRIQAELADEGTSVSRERIARLMREAGLAGISRRIVGWAMDSHLRTGLVLDALEMAIAQRRPARKVIHHSDQGSQYTSFAFGMRCRDAGVLPSMGSAGDCFDNAMAESFFASLECELIDRSAFRNRVQAKAEIFRYIEGWYNPHRRHSGIGQRSPVNFEKSHYEAA